MLIAETRAWSGNIRPNGNRASHVPAGFTGAGGRRPSITLTRTVTSYQHTARDRTTTGPAIPLCTHRPAAASMRARTARHHRSRARDVHRRRRGRLFEQQQDRWPTMDLSWPPLEVGETAAASFMRCGFFIGANPARPPIPPRHLFVLAPVPG